MGRAYWHCCQNRDFAKQNGWHKLYDDDLPFGIVNANQTFVY